MNLTSKSFKEDIYMVAHITCELANTAMYSTVDESKDNECNAKSLKCTMHSMANMLQSHGINLTRSIKTVRSKPKREDIILLKSMRMLAKSIEDLMMRNMDLTKMIDFDRVDYMQKLELLISMIKELEVKCGDKHE